MKIFNKKGEEKILSPYWFVILILIAGGVFAMVYAFYGTPYDVRELESRILMNQLADCISYKGEINDILISKEILLKDSSIFLDKCHINFGADNEEYYIEVNIYKLDDMDNSFFSSFRGNTNLIDECNIQLDKKYDNLATCLRGKFYSVDDAKNQYIIKILSVVRKLEQNIKL